MTYTDLLREFYRAGFQRVERDDRLADIFPNEDREKGVELWERLDQKNVFLLRVRMPFSVKGLGLYIIPKTTFEELLLKNTKSTMSNFGPFFQGEEAVEYLDRF